MSSTTCELPPNEIFVYGGKDECETPKHMDAPSASQSPEEDPCIEPPSPRATALKPKRFTFDEFSSNSSETPDESRDNQDIADASSRIHLHDGSSESDEYAPRPSSDFQYDNSERIGPDNVKDVDFPSNNETWLCCGIDAMGGVTDLDCLFNNTNTGGSGYLTTRGRHASHDIVEEEFVDDGDNDSFHSGGLEMEEESGMVLGNLPTVPEEEELEESAISDDEMGHYQIQTAIHETVRTAVSDSAVEREIFRKSTISMSEFAKANAAWCIYDEYGLEMAPSDELNNRSATPPRETIGMSRSV